MPALSQNVQTTDLKENQQLPKKPIRKPGKAYLFFKRALDIAISVVALIIAAIPMAIVVLAIKIETPGPALYIHNRVGKNGTNLPLLKFRSMYINAKEMMEAFTPEQKAEWQENFKLKNDPRITKVGKFLRKSSMDELPQLINVLKGELSIVGPRPIVTEELERYGENKELFLSVTPGLTGYWQAYARSNCNYEKRMEMELYYAENANFWWDIKIIFATFSRVIRGYGAQ